MYKLFLLFPFLFLTSCATYYHKDSTNIHKAVLKIDMSITDIKKISLYRDVMSDSGIIETFLNEQDDYPKNTQFKVDADQQWDITLFYYENWRETCKQEVKFFAKEAHIYTIRLNKTYGNKPTLFSKLLNLKLKTCDIEIRDNNKIIHPYKFPEIDISHEYYDEYHKAHKASLDIIKTNG